MELIDRETVGNEFDEQMYYLQYEVDSRDNPGRFFKADAINWCRNTLNDAPTVDAKPVVRGHWINEKVMVKGYRAKYCYDCSVCGKSTGYEYFPISNYCPSCGAKMDEVKE